MMNIQKSFDDEVSGKLYIVPTPIGNLEDMTYRALKTLKSVHMIAAEDTRNTQKLLNHFEFSTPLISYHEHNKQSRETELIERLKQGEAIALVSDAGMPGISDPGHELVQAAIKENLPVVVLPGANAALCALIGSGLSSDEFIFYGFLPRKKKDRQEELERLASLQATILLYESPYRIKDTMRAIREQFGNRNIAIARELTKRFEEYVRGTAEELIAWSEETELRGEFCLVIEGSQGPSGNVDDMWWSHLSINDHVEHYIESENISSKDAIKRVAKERKLSKRDVYQSFHVDK